VSGSELCSLQICQWSAALGSERDFQHEHHSPVPNASGTKFAEFDPTFVASGKTAGGVRKLRE